MTKPVRKRALSELEINSDYTGNHLKRSGTSKEERVFIKTMHLQSRNYVDD